MYNHNVLVRSGTQFRTCPATGTEVRINPARALRPMAVGGASSPTQGHEMDDELCIDLLPEDKALLYHLIFNGITKTQVKQYFGHLTQQQQQQAEEEQEQQQIFPILQFYKKQSHTRNLPAPLVNVIDNLPKTNPFAPPSNLVKCVVELDSHLLNTIDNNNNNNNNNNNTSSCNDVLTLNNAHEVLTFVQPTSSVYNYELYSKLVVTDTDDANGDNDDEQNKNDKLYLHPAVLTHKPQSQSDNDLKWTTSYNTPEISTLLQEQQQQLKDNNNNIDWTTILSPTGQLWGLFVNKPLQVLDNNDNVYEYSLKLPYKYRNKIYTSFKLTSVGESAVFLNKFPFAMHHSVVTISQSSYIKLNHFGNGQLFSTFYNILNYLFTIKKTFINMLNEKIDYNVSLFQSTTNSDDNNNMLQYDENIFNIGDVSYNNNNNEIEIENNNTKQEQEEQQQDDNNDFLSLTPTVVWNYLPPSAGSLIHPHLQVYCEDFDNVEIRNIKQRVYNFYKQQQKLIINNKKQNNPLTCNIPDHVYINLQKYTLYNELQLLKQQQKQEEKEKEEIKQQEQQHSTVYKMINQSRYIKQIPIDGSDMSIHIVAPFAPKMNNQIDIYIANLNEPSSLNSNTKQHVSNLIELLGIDNNNTNTSNLNILKSFIFAIQFVLQIYNKMGFISYNAASTSAAVLSPKATTTKCEQQQQTSNNNNNNNKYYIENEEMLFKFSFVQRPSIPAIGLYANDSGPLERQLLSNVISTPPEVYAAQMRDLAKDIDVQKF